MGGIIKTTHPSNCQSVGNVTAVRHNRLWRVDASDKINAAERARKSEHNSLWTAVAASRPVAHGPPAGHQPGLAWSAVYNHHPGFSPFHVECTSFKLNTITSNVKYQATIFFHLLGNTYFPESDPHVLQSETPYLWIKFGMQMHFFLKNDNNISNLCQPETEIAFFGNVIYSY